MVSLALALTFTLAAGLSGAAQSSTTVDPYTTVEAEAYDAESGTRTGAFAGAVGYIEDGDYITFDNVAFGRGPLAGEVRASSDRAGGTIEFRVDAPDGILVAEAEIGSTGGWSDFETFPIEVVNDYSDGTAFLSTQDLFLVFRGGEGFLFDVDAFSFTPADVPATGVEIVNCPFTFRPFTVGDEFAIEAQVLPANAVNQSVFFSSSDPGVIEVVDITTGEIRAVGPGDAFVTVAALDGGFVDSCEVRVLDVPVDPYSPVVALDYSGESGTQPGGAGGAVGFIDDGDYLRFNRVEFGRGPAGGTVRASSKRAGGTIEFRLDAPDGLLVAASEITGTGEWNSFENFPIEVFEDYSDGTAFVATRDLYLVFRGGNGFLFDVSEFVFTTSDVPVTAVSFANCPAQLRVGETFVLDVAIEPDDAVNQNLLFTTSNSQIIQTDGVITGDITAAAPGTATINVTAYDGGFGDACTIEVVPGSAQLRGPIGGGSAVDVFDDAMLTVYPNPSATGEYRLSDDAPQGRARLFDAGGRELRQVEVSPGATLDLTDLPNGRYLLRAESGEAGLLVKGQ